METHKFLDEVGFVLDKRMKEYGSPIENFKEIANRWSLTLGQTITPAQVALLMMDLKMARLKENPDSFDSLIDIAGYAACLAEIKREPQEFTTFCKNDLKLLSNN